MGSKPSKSKKSSGKHSTDGLGSDPENSANPDKRFKKQSKKSSGGSSDRPTMPLFGHKQSEAGKKKQQDKVFLAQQSPEATVDVSECDATEVPHGIFGICKLLRKEALLLHTNWLTSLKGGGSILDLISIRVLDLHSNELASLPDDICMLINLQVLNLERNKLSRLPADIGNLRSLQNLNLRANRLKVLPDSMTKLKSLRSLDVTDNHIVHLPRELCQVRTLETLQVDTPSMVYPDSETCSQGTEAMMRKLCSDCNIDYIPPSTFLLDILEPPKVNSPTMSENPFKGVAEDVEHMASFAQYAEQQEKKRLEQLEVQREFENQRTQQAQQASVWAADKQDLVKVLAAGEAKVFEELNYLTERKERERVELVASIHEVELQAADLMNQLLKVNEKAKKTEEIMEQMERERMEQEEWFLVRQEESDNLRKQEVLVAMERLMADNKNFEKLWDMYLADKADYSLRASHSEAETNDQINSVLQLKQKEQDALFDILCQQEKLQKEAFEALQLQKDMKHMRLTSEISLIQEELIKLSRVELDRNDQRQETTMNILKEKRLALTGMMMQLIDEREKRAIELKRRTREMEQRKLDGQIDYWLVQYQRLMDRKPQELIDQENLLEIAVLKILEQAGAGDYIPLFSRHRITIETMVTLSDADIKQMGVHEMGLRRSILRKVDDYKEKEGAAEKKTYKADARLPSAPSRKDVEAPSPDLKARGVDSECCICMERKSSVIFLACGHVCTCEICSPTVTECPLCRCEIHQRIALIA